MKKNKKNEKFNSMSKKEKYVYAKTLWMIYAKVSHKKINPIFWIEKDIEFGVR